KLKKKKDDGDAAETPSANNPSEENSTTATSPPVNKEKRELKLLMVQALPCALNLAHLDDLRYLLLVIDLVLEEKDQVVQRSLAAKLHDISQASCNCPPLLGEAVLPSSPSIASVQCDEEREIEVVLKDVSTKLYSQLQSLDSEIVLTCI